MRWTWYHCLKMSTGARAPSLFLCCHLQCVAPTLRVTRWWSLSEHHTCFLAKKVWAQRTKDGSPQHPITFEEALRRLHQWLLLASLANTGSQDHLELQGRTEECLTRYASQGNGKLMVGRQQVEEHYSCGFVVLENNSGWLWAAQGKRTLTWLE